MATTDESRVVSVGSGVVAAARRVSLRGFERTFVASEKSMKIATVMTVHGDIMTMVRYLPRALRNTFNMHPRMRALCVKGEPFVAEIQPPVTLKDISEKNLLRVQHHPKTAGSGCAETLTWEQFVQDECLVSFDRYTELPFFLTVWPDDKSKSARMLLFSDHFMSDAISGLVVLNCVLEQVALLAKVMTDLPKSEEEDLEIAIKEFPLRLSSYEQLMPSFSLAEVFTRGVMTLFGHKLLQNKLRTFKTVLPMRKDQHDFAIPPRFNDTRGFFAEGEPKRMDELMRRCKEERVTFGGVLVAVLVMGFYHTKRSLSEDGDPTGEFGKNFKLVANVAYNMRRRVPHPVEENPVGSFMSFGDLEWIATEGVDLHSTRFWDFARQAKSVIDAYIQNPMKAVEYPVLLDLKLHSQTPPSFLEGLRVPNSTMWDTLVNNVGRYPFKTKHELPVAVTNADNSTATANSLQVKSCSTYCALPHLSQPTTFWVTTVESFSYSMAYKCETVPSRTLFDACVAICESAGSIGSDETMSGVLGRLQL